MSPSMGTHAPLWHACGASCAEVALQAEGRSINKSLTTLNRVVTALSEGRSHVPFRDSTLTRVLQGSLGGNTQVFIIANVSPSSMCVRETLSTLRYMSTARRICRHVHANVEPMVMLQATAAPCTAAVGLITYIRAPSGNCPPCKAGCLVSQPGCPKYAGFWVQCATPAVCSP